MKTVDTLTLKKLVAHSRLLKLNRLMSKVAERNLDPDGMHVLSHPLVHGDADCIRATCVLCKMKDHDEPYQGVLDFSFDDWNRLPDHKEQS